MFHYKAAKIKSAHAHVHWCEKCAYVGIYYVFACLAHCRCKMMIISIVAKGLIAAQLQSNIWNN